MGVVVAAETTGLFLLDRVRMGNVEGVGRSIVRDGRTNAEEGIVPTDAGSVGGVGVGMDMLGRCFFLGFVGLDELPHDASDNTSRDIGSNLYRFVNGTGSFLH